eukprot:6973315-Prymnesium_polylepis.1
MGWLPASLWHADTIAAAAISPLSAAGGPALPPILMLVGGSDEVVPRGQQRRFAEAARRAGNR